MNQQSNIFKIGRLRPLLSLATCCAALLCGGTAFGQTHGVGISKGVAGPNLDFNLSRAHIGDEATVQMTVFNLDFVAHSITLTSLVDVVFFQSGAVTSLNLFAGNPGGVTLPSLSDFYTTNTTYIVELGDTSIAPNFSAFKLVDTAFTRGIDDGTGLEVTASAPAILDILIPSILVTKECALTGTLDNPIVTYSGIVSNTGNTLLTNVVVVDDNATPGDTSDDVSYPIGDLAVAQSAPYNGTYLATGTLSTNTVVAFGTDALDLTVSNTANCTVEIDCNPSIVVTKACPADPVPAGSDITVSGTVTNTGNVTLFDVLVVNDQPVPETVVFGPVTLAPGEGAAFTATYATPSNPVPCSVTDTFFASGVVNSNAICSGTVVSNSATVICPLICGNPNICVTKEITCFVGEPTKGKGGGSIGGGCEDNYSDLATGVKTADELLCPSFCYRITVTNCGLDTLTNVTVIDSKLDLSGIFPTTLTPGQVVQVIVSAVRHCNNTTNTVTATGTSEVNGQTVSALDSAVAVVKIAEIICEKIVVSEDAVDNDPLDNFLLLPAGDVAHTVTFYVKVSNNGDVDLANVTISDAVLAEFGCAPPAPFSLAAGDSVTISLCTNLLSCINLPLTNVITVSAEIDRGTNFLCVHDSLAGTNVTVSSTCDAIVACQPPSGCRTTGGGRQERDKTFPLVRYVTHGGQVGAPVGNANSCDPDSACIRGEWQHVRHIQGGLKGNFHARTFDSLNCACLACDGGPGETVGGICNANDRDCGPLPRKAPANKIAFSGVGNYALTNGRRTPRSVLFRVDIEDRSEPGGSHPKGGNPPPDRYRIRIWVLNAAQVARLNDPNDRMLTERCAIAATPQNTPLLDGTSQNQVPTPLGEEVFGLVGLPLSIDDGGELDRGNRQIHPQIKACP